MSRSNSNSSGGQDVDLYAILGVSRTCSNDELKRSYKKLCIQHHPDKGGDENEFKKISEAYNILKDPEKRELYDRFGIEGLKSGVGAQNMDVQSMMQNLFGMNFGRRESQTIPPPRYVPIELTLEEVVNGKPGFVYRYERKIVDRTKERKTCSACQGQGFRVMSRQMGFMQMQQQVGCPQCKGNRYENVDELFQSTRESISIDIPPNCAEHHQFILKNQQDERLEGESGDIVLVVEYAKHPTFHRYEYDLYMTIKLSLVESLTGFRRTVKLLNNVSVEVAYPYMIRRNEVLMLPQKGLFKHGRASYGDLYFVFEIDYPQPVPPRITTQIIKELETNITSFTVSPPELVSRPRIPDIPDIPDIPSSSSASFSNRPPTMEQGMPPPPQPGPFQGGMPNPMECHQQ